jgi:two-component system, OmpR family, phosphate regulon sensor histidine kinase PhoR
MSISLIGIILVQVYWIKSAFAQNDDVFMHHAVQVLEKVSDKIDRKEFLDFSQFVKKITDSTGVEPQKEQLKSIYYFEKDTETKQTIIYTNTLIPENFGYHRSFFDKNEKPVQVKRYTSTRKTEVYNDNEMENKKTNLDKKPNITIEKKGTSEILNKANFEIFFRDIVSQQPIQKRLSTKLLNNILNFELHNSKINIPYEFAVFQKGKLTNVKSDNFTFDKCTSFEVPILSDIDGVTPYKLLINFPTKSNFVFSNMLPMTMLSLLFTLIIIFTYSSALKQLITQKQISEIKTDFINNMTHEFKTPIATINLALDAIKNPQVISDKEKIYKYLHMIKEENKRMLGQVENVLQISRLEKNELDIEKEPHQIDYFIEDAIDHVTLMLEDKEGQIITNFKADKNTVLINDSHFTNVLVNVLDNAIKYNNNKPIIKISTENSKEFVVIKIEDNGIGMTKSAQKKVFDKFYREHTGDLHNVKGHGLGLAYVKQIIDDHNGQISVESEKDKGTIFTIKIPLIN